MTAGWNVSRGPWPLPPKTVNAMSPYRRGIIDIRWSSPAEIHENEGWLIRGVNIYRSQGSDRGPYNRINVLPIGGTFYRDAQSLVSIHEEIVTNWISFGDQVEDPYRFRTAHTIASPYLVSEPSFSGRDVLVTVNGYEVPARTVMGNTGEISLEARYNIDPMLLRKGAPLTISDTDEVTVSYLSYDPANKRIDKRSFYRVSTLAEDASTGELYETPLEHCPPVSDAEIEKIDYIWREGIRRNNWMLEQGGERVKFFTRRVSGTPCACSAFDPQTITYGKQPDSLCMGCFGTGISGGYDGPYELIIAPDEAERRISQLAQGRRKEHTYEVWIGPSPMVTQRDFIVKQNNDRYSIGAVRYPSNRGSILQQHFNIAYLDSNDIRYKVPVDGVPSIWPRNSFSYNTIRETYDARSDVLHKTETDNVTPMVTDKPELSAEGQVRGRTVTWENQNH